MGSSASKSCGSSTSSSLSLFLENFLSSLTSGVCLQLVDSPAMGQPVFGLDVRLEHTSANISQRGNVVDLLLYILTAFCLIYVYLQL